MLAASVGRFFGVCGCRRPVFRRRYVNKKNQSGLAGGIISLSSSRLIPIRIVQTVSVLSRLTAPMCFSPRPMLGQCQPKCVGAKTHCEDLLLAKACVVVDSDFDSHTLSLALRRFTTFKMLARSGGLDCVFGSDRSVRCMAGRDRSPTTKPADMLGVDDARRSERRVFAHPREPGDSG